MVTQAKIDIAVTHGLLNVETMAQATEEADVPFAVACALFEKESHGANVYGHDAGGALSGYPRLVTEDNFHVFWWLVDVKGQTSNGVGPSQITWPGYFRQMLTAKQKPWDIHDNMLKGLTILKDHYLRLGSWQAAGTAYNGDPAYGADLQAKIEQWRAWLNA